MLNEKKKSDSVNNAALAKRFGLSVVLDIMHYPFVVQKKQIIPYGFAKAKQMLPIDEKEGVLVVAIGNPLDLAALEEIQSLTGKAVEELYCPKNELEEALEECYRQNSDETKAFIRDLNKESPSADQEKGVAVEAYDLLDNASSSPVIQLLNMVLSEAITQGVSDVHFEPLESGLAIRYRVDGILQQKHTPPKEMQNQLITRIKVMAKMDIAEHRLPQDGRIKLVMGGREVDFRVSSVPVIFGERLVLRILDNSKIILGLGQLGLSKNLLKEYEHCLKQAQGILLVTGPTGSGKTTTLYSSLGKISTKDINVMTIEDPVEYKLANISQISVNRKIGVTFAKGLRSILRQDPDVILVGEIRDRETAEIAIQSSLTGHLVLSTLHTNDAPSALVRLLDMGIEPFLLASSIIGVLAQRLVRVICTGCKKAYEPSGPDRAQMGNVHADKLFKGEGCSQCLHTGYAGRVGIYEFMKMTPAICQNVVSSPNLGLITEISKKEGMVNLREYGMHLVREGKTTLAEIIRVTNHG
ncbi:type II secretion system protein GspE [Candidatus Aerophobetes bacterium]|uniref:protein-secreting ATPase n=1 Tax=Aerophobetes bacterium TaxID=2030807 RepID=A0A2A4X4X3_UNCAE|nr:MAG: type II secretion system protein GspE [Candidatus Aerophobetes bacterium]